MIIYEVTDEDRAQLNFSTLDSTVCSESENAGSFSRSLSRARSQLVKHGFAFGRIWPSCLVASFTLPSAPSQLQSGRHLLVQRDNSTSSFYDSMIYDIVFHNYCVYLIYCWIYNNVIYCIMLYYIIHMLCGTACPLQNKYHVPTINERLCILFVWWHGVFVSVSGIPSSKISTVCLLTLESYLADTLSQTWNVQI